MANMGYCRFQNTLIDLRDCADVLEEEGSALSDDEEQAKVQMVKECKRFIRAAGAGSEDGE
jgi:hypothetical protein